MLLRLISFGFVENQETDLAAIEPVKTVVHDHEDTANPKAALRRQMYERIARGNALNEAEENARRAWCGD